MNRSSVAKARSGRSSSSRHDSAVDVDPAQVVDLPLEVGEPRVSGPVLGPEPGHPWPHPDRRRQGARARPDPRRQQLVDHAVDLGQHLPHIDPDRHHHGEHPGQHAAETADRPGRHVERVRPDRQQFGQLGEVDALHPVEGERRRRQRGHRPGLDDPERLVGIGPLDVLRPAEMGAIRAPVATSSCRPAPPAGGGPVGPLPRGRRPGGRG